MGHVGWVGWVPGVCRGGRSCRGGVGWVMQGWGGVGHVGWGWSGSCRGGWSWPC